MTPSELILFVGLGVVYAASATGLWALAVAGATRSAPRAAAIPAVFLTTFFLALTHHPLPDPGTLDCSDGGMPARLTPFRFISYAAQFWTADNPAQAWLGNLSISSSMMNLVLCVAIGAALVPILSCRRHVLLFAASLSGTVELSQLTGLFGLYDCPYRQFDVDDLILNVAGILIGYTAMRALRPR